VADGFTVTQVVFWVLAIVMLISALGVVTAGNIVYAALFFIAALAGVAGIYLMLAVEFLALVQLLIYGAAVVILILFALMLTRARERPQALFGRTRPLGIAAAAGLLAALIGGIVATHWVTPGAGGEIQPVALQQIGDVIFTVWIVPFIIVGLLLSIALDGAIMLASPDEEG
jgi:NADH-quinone oxidoreductase subunit J